jgi:hypothetical protein
MRPRPASGRDALFAQQIEQLHQRAHVFGTHSLFSHKVAPIRLDYFLIDLLDREILLLKPPVEMPDQPELDPLWTRE